MFQFAFDRRLRRCLNGLFKPVITQQTVRVIDPGKIVRVLRDLKISGLGHRMRRQKFRYYTLGCLVPVGAARLGKQVCKFLAFACRLSHRLQTEIANQPRAETFPLFYSHRIEGTAVRVDADEEFVFRFKIL